MKFMLNGAVTLGTVDGANVEIGECVGEDNIFTFGMLTDEVDALWKNGYSSTGYLAHNDKLRRIIDRLKFGFDGESFADIAAYLIMGQNGVADPYMCLADYNDYMRANRELDAAYKDSKKFNSMALVNVAKSGIFAADRSIDEYAKNIWGLRRVKQPN